MQAQGDYCVTWYIIRRMAGPKREKPAGAGLMLQVYNYHIVAELKRRAESGEQSPLDALFGSIWEPTK